MSDDRALDAAAEALNKWTFAHYEKQVFSDLPDAVQQCVAAYLDHLLGDLPEEAVEAAEPYARDSAPGNARRKRVQQEAIARAVLRSLRAALRGPVGGEAGTE